MQDAVMDSIPAASACGVVDLDRRMSRALEQERGMKFSAAELAILASTGAYGALRFAAGQLLEENARCRVTRTKYTAGESSACGGIKTKTELSGPRTLPYSGMMQSAAGTEALQRAKATLGRRGKS
jgi:hypothetical protein